MLRSSAAIFTLALLSGTALSAAPAAPEPTPRSDVQEAQQAEDKLPADFLTPPESARPRVWWHWMNGNITKDGIAKDLAWMKRVGIGGVTNFDINIQTPQIVDKRLIYMTPEWKDAFRFAVQEAERQGLEFAIASSPGWSETGGPWVKPEDGLKKIVWSEMMLTGGKRFTGRIPTPPSVTGPFQAVPKEPEGEFGHDLPDHPERYEDIAVYAVPATIARDAVPKVSIAGGRTLSAATLTDGNLETGEDVPIGSTDAPTSLLIDYAKSQTLRSIRLFIPGAKQMFRGPLLAPTLEYSDNGDNWHKITDIVPTAVPTTVSFKPVTARLFRIQLHRLPYINTNGSVPAPGVVQTKGLEHTPELTDPWSVRELTLSSASTISNFEAKAGFALVQDYFALPVAGDDAAGPKVESIINLTGKMKPDGSLNWTPPKGDWRIIRIGYSLLGTTNHPAPAEATGLEVDKYDGAAVRRYITHYLDMYKDTAGAEMLGTRGISALLTDSIEVGAANWTPLMIEQFKRLRGYDPTPWLPALTGTLIGTRADSDRFLFDYRRTLSDLIASEHYGTIAKTAHDYGLKVYGEALEDHRQSIGDDMTMRSHADIPMAAMWTFPEERGPSDTFVADIKGAASVAHIYGQNIVAAESLTSAYQYWRYSPAMLKKVIDTEFVLGVNRPVIHDSVHVPVDDKQPGLSLFIFGQNFNRMDSWAEMAKPWVDYISRNSLMLQYGRNLADVGYFYGEEAPLVGLYGDKLVADAPTANAYDFVSADALLGMLSNDGAAVVSPGGARYQALYLGGSSRQMTLAVLRKLAALAEGGATIIGMKPDASPSHAGDPAEYARIVARLWGENPTTAVGKGRVIASQDVDAALKLAGIAPDFHFNGGQDAAAIPFVHRTGAEGDSYFLVNRKNRAERIEAHFRITGKQPELWHAETGAREALSYRIENGETIVPLALAGEESVHIVFRKASTAPALTVKTQMTQALPELDGPWRVDFEPGRGAPATITLDRLAPLDRHSDPAVRHFSGVATYSNRFTAPRGWKPGAQLWLDLGTVREMAEIIVNGQPAGYAWHAPYRIDIGNFARSGTNTLQIKVANLWVNRLIGDAQPGVEKIAWTAIPTYKADAPLMESGLIGPVRLESAKTD